MIDKNTIQAVHDRADIFDVVSRFVELKRSGRQHKGCCPFHSEKTPSFFVNPARNTWTCYGCNKNGDAIQFIREMRGCSFSDAVKELAGYYGVIVDESRISSQDIEIAHKRETMKLALEVVQKYFIENLYLSSKDSTAARYYATKRWGEQFVKEMGIGYAPDSWNALVDHVRNAHLSMTVLEDMGIVAKSEKSGKYYSSYRHRITIPIRNEVGILVGFTARYIGDLDDTPKYINSRTSLLYSKEKVVFGFNHASREAATARKLYLTEGAPDALKLQSININNAVASLGAVWTDNQFKLLKRVTTNLCFLPDADPPKRGELLGKGTMAVMTNGINALKHGFNVTVKEIPLTESGEKNDPDSYITSKSVLQNMEERDFVMWYAQKTLIGCSSTDEKRAATVTICRLLANLDDKVKESMYIDYLAKEMPSKTMWRQALNAARKEQEIDKLKNEENNVNLELLDKFGFQEKNNVYFSISDGGKSVEWSNFTMKPLFHIIDNLTAIRIYKLKNRDGITKTVELKQEDLISLSKFKLKVESLGNFLWKGSEAQLTKLKEYLYATTESAEIIKQLGWQKQGFFAFGNGIFTTEWHEVDELGIVRLGDKGNYYLPAFSSAYQNSSDLFRFERGFAHYNYSNVPLGVYMEKFIGAYGDNAIVGLGFFLATLFADIIRSYNRCFPLLNLFGQKGTGKSQYANALMAFFYSNIEQAPNLSNSTYAALADSVAQCANAFVHLEELRNDMDTVKRDFLKGIYDGTGRTRINIDLDKKKEITKVDSGVIVSGQEMATADIALLSRVLFVPFNKTAFSRSEQENFAQLSTFSKQGCTHIVLQLLPLRPKLEANWKSVYQDCFAELTKHYENRSIDERQLQNWCVIYAVYRILLPDIDVPVTLGEVRSIVMTYMERENKYVNNNSELADFWNILSFLNQDNQIWDQGDYRIDSEVKFKSDYGSEMVFPQPKKILKLRYDRIFNLYKIHGRKVNETLLPQSSLVQYLEHSKAFMGKKRAVKFTIMKDGNPETVITKDSRGNQRFSPVKKAYQAYCFDYVSLQEEYGLNLKSAWDDGSDAED